MGCDVHFGVEARDPATGKWSFLLPPAPPSETERTEMRDEYAPRADGNGNERTGRQVPHVSPFWGPGGCMYLGTCYGVYDDDGNEKGCKGAACEECLGTLHRTDWYHGRNYNVFAILTSTVRNDEAYPFKGIVPEPRGFPEDVDPRTLRVASGDHSEGWLSLDEVTGWDGWSRSKSHTGAIPLFERGAPNPWGPEVTYEEWSKTERKCPNSYSGSVSGPSLYTISEVDADRILAAPDREHEVTHREEHCDLVSFATGRGFQMIKKDTRVKYVPGGTARFYVQATWTESYRESAKNFLAFIDEIVLPTLARRDIATADVRFVFNFDS